MMPWTSLAAGALMFISPNSDIPARLDSLADATTAGIGRFADRHVAIAEGYRRIGTDFPGMGEHWIHTSALLGGRLDPTRPTVLAYATIGGAPRLIGAGFVFTTTGAEAADVPGWPTFWHEHSGALADETGAHVGARDTTATATHVWVLHIWTTLANPRGRYEADNWALPFARAGILPPSDVDHEMGRAMSLAVAQGDEYLSRLLTTARLRTGGNAARVDALINEAREATKAIIARGDTRAAVEDTSGASPLRTLAPGDAQSLRLGWRRLSEELRAMLGAEVDPLLAPPHQHREESAAAAKSGALR